MLTNLTILFAFFSLFLSFLSLLTTLLVRNSDLSRNFLSFTIPSEFGLLTNLQVLDLFQNQLSSIPTEIGNLANLLDLLEILPFFFSFLFLFVFFWLVFLIFPTEILATTILVEHFPQRWGCCQNSKLCLLFLLPSLPLSIRSLFNQDPVSQFFRRRHSNRVRAADKASDIVCFLFSFASCIWTPPPARPSHFLFLETSSTTL